MSEKINTEVIREVFKSMNYSTENKDIKGDAGDLIKLVKQRSVEEVNTFLTTFTRNDQWGNFKISCRQDLMLRLATTIENEEHSFVALEQRIRGTSPTYVKTKSLPFLVKSLRYNAMFCRLIKKQTKDIHLARVSEINCLSLLGYVLGPSLAAGRKILFVTSNKLGPIIKFIIQLINKIGFPPGTVSVLLDDVDLNSLMKHARVVSIFEETMKLSNKKIISILPNLIPFIIFDSSDLDSACESVINATWNNNLIFNSTAKEVFVQETIYKQFVEKLKEKLISNNSFDTNSDKIRNCLQNLISKAENDGIEVFPPKTSDTIGKIALIGGRINDKNFQTIPFVSVTAFRNIGEGVALANNNTQGLSASVWTENIGLANVVAQKLNVSNVWINCFDIYSPDVSFTPRKCSGKGYFGGIQGFNQIIQNNLAVGFQGVKATTNGNGKTFTDAVNLAKKALQSWGTLEKFVRISKFQKIFEYIQYIKNEVKSKTITEEWMKEWELFSNEFMESNFNCSVSSPVQGYNLHVKYEARGVLVMETTNIVENHNKKLLIASILEGNTLVLVNESLDLQRFYNEFSKQLPRGVLNVVPYFDAVSVYAAKNPTVDGYFNEYFIDEELECCNKFIMVSETWPDVHSKVTYVKNVWSNIGICFSE